MLNPDLYSLLPMVLNAFARFVLFSTKSWLWKRREDACVDLFVISWNIPTSVFRTYDDFTSQCGGSCLLPVEITEWQGLEGTWGDHPVQPPPEAGSPSAGCTGPRPGRV